MIKVNASGVQGYKNVFKFANKFAPFYHCGNMRMHPGNCVKLLLLVLKREFSFVLISPF